MTVGSNGRLRMVLALGTSSSVEVVIR
jgi:hypothetical protein